MWVSSGRITCRIVAQLIEQPASLLLDLADALAGLVAHLDALNALQIEELLNHRLLFGSELFELPDVNFGKN